MLAVTVLKNRLTHLIHLNAKQRMALFGVVLIILAYAGFSITDYLVAGIRQDIVKRSEEAMQSVSVYLGAELNELELVDDILAGLPWVAAALESGKPKDLAQANEGLQSFNQEKGTAVCYILDRKGTTVASSNYRDQDSFVGKNYGFRKYFSQAVRGISAIDFALGVTSLKKGLYVGSPIRDNYNRVIGVAVVKKDLDLMETLLRQYPDYFFVNHLGIILLSSNPDLTLKRLWPLGQKMVPGASDRRPSDPFFPYELKNGTEVEFRGGNYLVSRDFIGQDGWSVVFLANMEKVHAYRVGGFLVTAGALCLLVLANLAVHSWGTMPEKMARIHKQAGSPDNLKSFWF